MNDIVPPSLLFDFQLSIPRCKSPASSPRGHLLKLPDSALLFTPSCMNGSSPFAAVSAAWNDDGFAVSVSVTGKSMPVAGSSQDLTHSDGVFLWIDTRPSGNVHRATEYCHHFACLPVDNHVDGAASVVVQPIAQQRMQRVESDPRKMSFRTYPTNPGYDFELWIPGSQLYGYREITDIGRLGFYYVIQDTELGNQHLATGEEFPYSYDPSVWLQLELLP